MSLHSKITNATIAYHSVLWFAHDDAGNIIVADSCEGDIPGFVKSNLQNTEFLSQALCGINAIAHTRVPPIDYQKLADMGFYCFQGDDYDGAVYHLRATPATPVCLDDLDPAVKQILNTQKIPINVNTCQQFRISP